MELSIFYNGQFFVALVEYKMENKSKFIQYTFGNEPDDIEVLDFIHHQLMKMIDDVQTIVYTKNISRKVNPKRLQRQIAKEQKKPKYSTQAQIAIKKELELKKKQKRKNYKENVMHFKKEKEKLKRLKQKRSIRGISNTTNKLKQNDL
ncbi:TPA: YjdF family protein [Staphylococcus aureus]|uniref:DUF2992 family protein n=1 Tax=Staphylococcus aureus TaxID=1280 RepID=UPI00228BB75E|nr:YjdF family protein [Staphylococcus aureus]HCV2515098.1 YjdF family protein [Staphylococcus aureus]HCX9102821.1 YjdF family protein [Staphylococcus aureus]HCX9385703.1 YjdF family protein [Staphylococcus aureus]HCX9396590.1 YjdF family protein [Staphylococcus aureus]